MKVLKIISRIDGEATEFDGRFIVSYDANEHLPDGSYIGGHLVTSSDPALAKQFDDVIAALEYWKTTPNCKCHRTRWDGQPNRPLTAFTVTVWDTDAKDLSEDPIMQAMLKNVIDAKRERQK